jgi:iron complex transport system substrate-binding protein
MTRLSKLLTFFLLFIMSCVSLTACNDTTRSASTHYDDYQTTQQTRIIKHALGEVEVPLDPQRVVTINPVTLEAALALGVQPVGGSHWDWNQPYLQGKVDNIQDVGWIPDVNLEKIAVLNPDFIIGSAYQQSIYNLVSQIAPTFLAEEPPKSNSNWEETFIYIAEGLDRTEMAAQVMADYHTRLEEFKQKRGDRHKGMKVSVAALYQGNIRVYSKNSFPGSILEDAGLSRPSFQLRERRFNISKERLGDLDGDALFLINNPTDTDSQKTLQQFRTDPLWAKLNVVQNKQVFEVGDYWLCCGPLAANAVIDDLFKYLIEER